MLPLTVKTGAKKTFKGKKKVNLALQGGGALGAYSWGVLDALLEDGRIEFSAISGTSAGAMNAVALADGYLAGGPDGARRKLAEFWNGISETNRLVSATDEALDALFAAWRMPFSPYDVMRSTATMASPYTFNPINYNPLLDMVTQLVDFDRIRSARSLRVFVSATHVESGKIEVFTGRELSPEAVMASACLPDLFQAVEIGGESYWDGGYSGNPAMWPFHNQLEVDDILLIQLDSVAYRNLPNTPNEIFSRIRELTFNSSLIHELQAIHFTNRLIDEDLVDNPDQHRRWRLHRIDADHAFLGTPHGQALDISAKFISELFAAGRAAGTAWLGTHFDKIGKQQSLDLGKEFTDRIRVPTGLLRAAGKKTATQAGSDRKQINLALQGGGGRGPFIWGVLDAVLVSGEVDIAAISASGGGAITAVITAQGLIDGGPEQAQVMLEEFWRKVARNRALLASAESFLRAFRRLWVDQTISQFDIARFLRNRLDHKVQKAINPLREIVASMVDFEAVRRSAPFPIFVSATEVNSGKTRLFHGESLTLEAVMASSCLPYLFAPVEIDGIHYWDGGYSGNPALWPFLGTDSCNDILLVQLFPRARKGIPRSPNEIIERIAELTFNNSLLEELRALDVVNQLIEDGHLDHATFARNRVHRIAPSEDVLRRKSGRLVETGMAYFQQLHRGGRDAGERWLREDLPHVGDRDTFDMSDDLARRERLDLALQAAEAENG